jgi:hypothetical protein
VLDDEIKNLTEFIKRSILEVNELKSKKNFRDAFNGSLVLIIYRILSKRVICRKS